jgi:biotin transport system substrate-specific component
MSHRQTQTRNLILAGLFSALMIVGANLRIPFPLVPLTFQPFFAILSGLLLGASVGMVSQAAYLLLGLAGLPVFADGSAGLLYVTRPTFGFLIGFVLASGVAGLLTRGTEKPTFKRVALASLAGLGIIYGIGVLYMYLIQSLYFAMDVSLMVIVKGMSLFFLKDLLLFLAASVLAVRLIPLLRRSQAK